MPLSSFLTFSVIVVVLGVAMYSLSTLSMSSFWYLASIPPLIYFITRPEIWLAVMIAFYQSAFTLPWAPTNLNLFLILAVLFSLLMLIYPILRKSVRHRTTPVRKWVILFGMVITAIMCYRGIGIRFFGSALWGGAGYASLLVGASLFIAADLVTLSTRLWKRALITMCILSFVPLVAQLLHRFSGGAIEAQYLFVQRLGAGVIEEEFTEVSTNLTRFQSGMGFFLIMLPLLMFASPFRGKSLFLTLLLWIAALVSIGFSGYRSGIVTCIEIPMFWLLFSGKRLNWKAPIVVAFFMFSAVCIAALYAYHFPLSVQRSLSFIPFADVSNLALDDATGSFRWRLEVWHRAITEVLPHYLWTGQGLAFNPRELEEIMSLGLYDRDWAFVTRSYHNGPVSLLIIFGLPGAIAGFGFLFVASREYYRNLRRDWTDPLLFRLYRTIFAWFVVIVFGFCVTYGDVHVSFPQLFFIAMLLEGMIKTQESFDKKAAPDTTP